MPDDQVRLCLPSTESSEETLDAAVAQLTAAAHVQHMTAALQHAWDDFVADTGIPDCFELRGGALYADFCRGNFARYVAGWLTRLEADAHSAESAAREEFRQALAARGITVSDSVIAPLMALVEDRAERKLHVAHHD